MTIEFQHSHLEPGERAARERFDRNMLWVVDGARLKRDLPRFREGARSFREILLRGMYITAFPEEAFPGNWLDCDVPVFFDFENAIGHSEETMHLAHPLWCLLPSRAVGRAVVLQVSGQTFVGWTNEKTYPIQAKAMLDQVALVLAEGQRLQLANPHAAQTMHWRQRRQPRYRRRYARF